MHNSSAPDVRLRIVPLGNTLSLLLAISYLLCVGFGLLAPEHLRLRTFDHYSQAVGEFSNFIIHAHEA